MNWRAVTATFSLAGASTRESARAAMGTAMKTAMNCRWPKRSRICRWRCSSAFDILEWRRHEIYFENAMSVESAIHSDPLWYKDAVFYEIYVRGFYDSNADGIGDFRGLTEKLDYLKWLGIDCVWLLP